MAEGADSSPASPLLLSHLDRLPSLGSCVSVRDASFTGGEFLTPSSRWMEGSMFIVQAQLPRSLTQDRKAVQTFSALECWLWPRAPGSRLPFVRLQIQAPPLPHHPAEGMSSPQRAQDPRAWVPPGHRDALCSSLVVAVGGGGGRHRSEPKSQKAGPFPTGVLLL